MDLPLTNKMFKKPVFYVIITFFLLTTTSSVAAAPSQITPGPESGSIASLLGICLVSMGCLIFILSAMKHLNLTKKPKKSNSHPVLLDRLKDAQRIQLQKQITQAGQVSKPVAEENEERKFVHPEIPQTEETEKVEELLHAMAGTQDDDHSDES